GVRCPQRSRTRPRRVRVHAPARRPRRRGASRTRRRAESAPGRGRRKPIRKPSHCIWQGCRSLSCVLLLLCRRGGKGVVAEKRAGQVIELVAPSGLVGARKTAEYYYSPSFTVVNCTARVHARPHSAAFDQKGN